MRRLLIQLVGSPWDIKANTLDERTLAGQDQTGVLRTCYYNHYGRNAVHIALNPSAKASYD